MGPLEIKLSEGFVDELIPLHGHMLESVGALQQLPHSTSPILSSLGLLHVDVFLEGGIEEGCLNVSLVDLHSTMSCHCQACAQSAEFDDMREGGRVVNSWARAETLSYQSGHEATDVALCVGFNFEDPLVTYGLHGQEPKLARR